MFAEPDLLAFLLNNIILFDLKPGQQFGALPPDEVYVEVFRQVDREGVHLVLVESPTYLGEVAVLGDKQSICVQRVLFDPLLKFRVGCHVEWLPVDVDCLPEPLKRDAPVRHFVLHDELLEVFGVWVILLSQG